MASIEEVVAMARTLSPEERLRLIERLFQATPPDSWPQQSDDDMAAAKRRLMESEVRWMAPVPWPVVQRLLANSRRSSQSKVYSAPRRFDLATIFIVTIAYSLLFTCMSLLQLPPAVSLVIAGFITIVGIGQAILFGGKKPRTASIVVGMTIYALAILIFWIARGPRVYDAATILITGSAVVIGGCILGYAAGGCVGGVFLLADIVRRNYRWRNHPAENPVPEENRSGERVADLLRGKLVLNPPPDEPVPPVAEAFSDTAASPPTLKPVDGIALSSRSP